MTPSQVDALPVSDQVEMGALLVAERMKCPAGHPLSLSLRDDLVILVDDEQCHFCRATALVQRKREKEARLDDPKEAKPEKVDGLLFMARAKNGGAWHGRTD